MKKYLRIAAIMLSLIMLCSLFSGCFKKVTIVTEVIGGNSSETDDTSSDNSNTDDNTDNNTDNNGGNGGNNDAGNNDDPGSGDDGSQGGGSNDNSSNSGGTSSTNPSTPAEEEENVIKDYDGVERTVVVDMSKVVNKNYLGVGGNIVPYGYMPSNTAEGYNEAYYALDAQRLKTIGVNIVRFWIQVDWFEKQKGVYDFDTPEMFACRKYIQALKDADVDVQVTFSWKVGEDARPWYAIPGLDDQNISAPKDIEHFGEECVTLIKYLREDCGFTNVKHMAFANEPNGGWDWETLGYQPAYFASVIETVDKAFKDAGIRDDINIWAAEISSGAWSSWLSYFAKECGDCIDFWSIHESGHTNEDLSRWIDQMNGYAKKPLVISEYQEGSSTDYYTGGNAGHVVVGSQKGFGGIMTWDFWGVKHMSNTDEKAWEMDEEPAPDGRLGFVFHNHFATNMAAGSLGYHYYTLATLGQWVDRDNEVLKTTTTLSDDDMRTTTIKNKDGSITVIVEIKKSDVARELTVDFGKNVNKTFTRHVFLESDYPETWEYGVGPINVSSLNNPNGFMPKGDKTFNVTDKLVDKNIPKGSYGIIVYTTQATETQIGFREYDDVHATSVPVTVSKGASYQVQGYIYEGSGEIAYSIANPAEEKQGTISASGLYTADANANAGEVIAVKAYLKSNPNNYKILLIKMA